jgi:hypothetical protein
MQNLPKVPIAAVAGALGALTGLVRRLATARAAEPVCGPLTPPFSAPLPAPPQSGVLYLGYNSVYSGACARRARRPRTRAPPPCARALKPRAPLPQSPSQAR